MKLNLEAIKSHPDHLALYKLTIAGVGFMHAHHHKYDFYSHAGDFIGTVPTYRVQAFVAFMRRNFGLDRSPMPQTANGVDMPLTYIDHALVEPEIVDEWMDELWQSPITLH